MTTWQLTIDNGYGIDIVTFTNLALANHCALLAIEECFEGIEVTTDIKLLVE